MRIIGGKFKGRKFYPPADNWPTRPTTDFAKEGLFNILNNRIDFQQTVMLDLFGGTGSHSYEFISRGCEDVTYVDKFGACVLFVRKTAQILDIEPFIKIYKMDVFKFIQTNQRKYDISLRVHLIHYLRWILFQMKFLNTNYLTQMVFLC